MKQSSIAIDKDTRSAIKLMDETLAGGMRKGVKFLSRYNTVVYQLYCERSDKIYIGVASAVDYLEDRFLSDLGNSDSVIGKEIKLLGISEFDNRPVGAFSRINAALDYRDFLLNKYTDSGVKLYNNEIITGVTPRFIIVQIGVRKLNKLIKYCINRNITVNAVLNKLVGKFLEKF